MCLIKLLRAANTFVLGGLFPDQERKRPGNHEIPAGDGEITVTFLTVYGENGSRPGNLNKDLDLGFRTRIHVFLANKNQI